MDQRTIYFNILRQDQVCPHCGARLLTELRAGRKVIICLNHHNLPDGNRSCAYLIDAPEDQQLQQLGAPTLPGLEFP